MTTGSDVTDFRQIGTSEEGASYYYGTYWSRVWSGGDGPKPVAYPPRKKGAPYVRPPKRARSRGEHEYQMTLISYHYGNGGKFNPGIGYVQKGCLSSFWGYPSFQEVWTTNDDIALLGKLNAKVGGSTFNAAVSLAESHQALEMIGSMATRIAKAIHSVKRGDLAQMSRDLSGATSAVRRLRDLPGSVGKRTARNWLEFQYGVKPLLNDVYDAAVTLAHFTEPPVSNVYSVYRRVEGDPVPQNPYMFDYVGGYVSHSKKIKAIITEIDVPSLIGLQNPASVIWEKLPYSFVADWFIPIGNYLQARGFVQSLKGTFVTSDVYKAGFSGIEIGRDAVADHWSWTGQLADTRHRTVRLNRTVSQSLDVPLPSVKPLMKSATWLHAANAVALLTNLSSVRSGVTELPSRLRGLKYR